MRLSSPSQASRAARATVAFLLLGPASLLHAQGDEPVRVLLDTGFEEGLSPFVRQSGQPAVTSELARTGRQSLRIERSGAVLLPPVTYSRGKRFRLEFWMKTVDVARGTSPWNCAGAQVQVQGPFSGRLRHSDVGLTAGTTDWTRHERTIAWDLKQVPDAFQVVLHLWDAAAGTVYFDDVRLVELPGAAEDPRFPHPEDMAEHPPRVWPMPPVTAGPDTMDSGLVRVRFAPSGLPAQIAAMAAEHSAIGPFAFAATVGGVQLAADAMQPCLDGYDVWRGWMNRRRAVLVPAGGDGDSLPRLEVFTEVFRSSPLVAVFLRLWLPNETALGRATLGIALPGHLSQSLWFAGNTPQRTPASALQAQLGEGTTKPMLVVHTATDDQGVAIFHPLPPELRRWHMDDYVPRRLAVEVTGEGALTYRFDAAHTAAKAHCHSLDLTLLVHPYVGSVRSGLAPFAVHDARLESDELPFGPSLPEGYWSWPVPNSHRSLRVVRYHPWEAFASADAGAETFTYGHEGGFAWGWVSIPQKQMRFSPVSDNPWWRDSCLRLLAFHILRRDRSGTPPHLSTYKEWARNLEDLEDFQRRHFCQDIEFRVGEWRQLLTQAEYLTDADRRDIYRELQHIRALFDPASPPKVGWTTILPGGGYWYAYMNIPRMDMTDGPGYVLNTHMTSVGNAGELMLLARDMGEDGDFGVWRVFFERGVDGLLWALGDPRAWETYDPNVLRYGLVVGGPRGYHVYAASDWLPRVMRIAKEVDGYRLPELMAYHERLLAAGFMSAHPREREIGRRVLRQIREGQ